MDDARLIAREQASQVLGYRDIARGAPGSRGVEFEAGLFASVVPATPNASIPNTVLYTRPQSVVERWDDLRRLYDDAGVRAWTVWVRPGDEGLEAELLGRGHVLDATPGLMAAAITDLDLDSRIALDLSSAPLWTDVAHINDAAYGLPPGTLGAGLSQMPEDARLQPLVARLGGESAACLAWLGSDEGDCTVQMVATLPQARGHGLAGELMREALRRAREAGCRTASLEASGNGELLYARLGYRLLGRLHMLERRTPAP